MHEIENEAVDQQVDQDVASPEIEATQDTETESVQADDKSNRAFAELRIQKRDLERKAKLQEELLQQMINAQRMPQQQVQPEEDVIEQLAKQEYVAGQDVAKAFKKLKQEMRSEVEEVRKSNATQKQNSLLAEVKREYADFDQVVNSETLDLIEETNPRLAASLARTMTDDPYSFAIQSYEYIKSKGLAKPVSKRVVETEKKIEQNKKSVQSPQAFDKRPMAQAFDANQLTKTQKEALNREMHQFARQAGMGY
jgi:hypothetical protein